MTPNMGAQRQRKHRRKKKKNQAAKPPAQMDAQRQSQRRQRMANGGHVFRAEDKHELDFSEPAMLFYAQESTN